MASLLIVPSGSAGLPARASTLGSLVVHTGLIALAALGTQAPPPAPTPIRETTIFLPVDPRPSRPTPGLPSVPGTLVPRLPSVFQLPVTIPLPDVVPPGIPSAPWATDPWPGVPGTPGDTTSGAPVGHGLPLDARVVEDPPVLVSHPALRYPEILRQAGIEGEVLVEAVLDTAGRVEAGSAHVARGAHALMDAEALSVVRASQYRPGRMGSRAVRVRIRVPIRFALRR